MLSNQQYEDEIQFYPFFSLNEAMDIQDLNTLGLQIEEKNEIVQINSIIEKLHLFWKTWNVV